MSKVSNVEEYIQQKTKWHKELNLLRTLIDQTNLEPSIKWGAPVYALNKKNVVGMTAFTNHIALWFFQGGLLKDEQNKLVNAQEGKTQAMRHLKFKSQNDILTDVELIRAYLAEAIQNQKEGKVVKLAQKPPIQMPQELEAYFKQNKALSKKFEQLTPSAQREYFTYIHEAKKEATKNRRIEKMASLVEEGKGLNDQYKK